MSQVAAAGRPPPVRILGIDPGSHKLGWGVVEVSQGRLRQVAAGTLQAPAGDLRERLLYLCDQLAAAVVAHAPSMAAVERIFHAKNSHSALTLGHARGAVLVCIGRAGLAVHEYTAGQIKQAVTGRGRADKQQVQAMVRLLLGLSPQLPLGLDTSDALAAAVCHAQIACHPGAARWAAAAAGAGGRRA